MANAVEWEFVLKHRQQIVNASHMLLALLAGKNEFAGWTSLWISYLLVHQRKVLGKPRKVRFRDRFAAIGQTRRAAVLGFWGQGSLTCPSTNPLE